MSLIECVNCKAKISERAISCPKCNSSDPHGDNNKCSICGCKLSHDHCSVCPECGDPDPVMNEKVFTPKKQESNNVMKSINPSLRERIVSAFLGPLAAFMVMLVGYCLFIVFSFIFFFIIVFLPEEWYTSAVIVCKPFLNLWGFVMEDEKVFIRIYFTGAALLGFFKPSLLWRLYDKITGY